jgi:disulfide bond formation protein DsbB
MKTRITLLTLLLIATALVAVACAAPTPEPTPTATMIPPSPTPAGDSAAGAKDFAGTCKTCHGADAKGMPGLGKDLTTSEFVKSKTDDELFAFLHIGRPASDPANTTGVDMPVKGGNPAFSDQDLHDIIAFLRTINK